MKTSETILLVAGVGVAAFIGWQIFGGSSKPLKLGRPASANPIASLLGGLSSLGGLFGGPSPSSNGPAYGYGVQSTDSAAQQSYAISNGVADLSGNQIIDLNTGNALVYGTD